MRSALVGLTLALALGGCGSDSAPGAKSGSGGSAGTGEAAGTGGTAGGGAGQGGAAGAPCSDDPTGLPPDAVCVLEAHGSVVDAAGAPVPDLGVSVCGPVCFLGSTDASGAFTVPVGHLIPPSLYAAEAHGRPDHTNFYRALSGSSAPNIDVGQLRLLDFPATGPTLVVRTDKVGAPAQSVTSGDVTLDVPAGVSVKLDVEDVAQKDHGKLFRALTVPPSFRDEFVDPALGVVALYTFTPFEVAFVDDATLDPKLATLSAANTEGLAPGSAVEWLALGTYLFPGWLAPAEFQVVATGTVSSDGSRVEMDPGQGVPYLTWLAVRPKQ